MNVHLNELTADDVLKNERQNNFIFFLLITVIICKKCKYKNIIDLYRLKC